MRLFVPMLAVLAAAPAAFAQERNQDEEIVVTAERLRGSVPGNVTPETTFSAEDVRSYGASSIFQILAAVAPNTGSASIRGGGFPIVLINGRRVSGFQEIRDLPADVISRVEVFDEQLSLQYGFSPDQRVVNLVLERTYSASSAEAGAGVADVDARASMRAEAGFTEIDEGDRIALGLSHDAASSITELERDIAPPLSGPDTRAVRTLSPDQNNWRANASFSRALNERVTGTASVRVETSEQSALLGLDSASAPRDRDSESQSVRLAGALDGSQAGWQWTSTATADFTRQESLTSDSTLPARTRSDQTLYDITANANGALFDVPAGRARGGLRLGFEQRQIESYAFDTFGERRADLERTTPSGRITFSAPITSRRFEFGEAFGDISLNTSASWSEPSDFAALSSFGFGGSWSPIRALRFTLQNENSEAAPSLQQLGDPTLTTPDVSFFDVANGQSVLVTRTTGGNSALLAEERNDLVFNSTWSPPQVQGMSISFSWARNESQNALAALPTALPETEAAFPSRYVRDLGGVLTAIDTRPINLAQRDIESIRWGVSYSRSIGRQQQQGRPQRPAEGAPASVASPATPGAPSPTTPEGASPAERRMGLGGGQTAGAGRWNVSAFHRIRLMDDVTLAAGQTPIDVLDRGGLDGGGEPASSIEFEGGVFYRGLGLRFNGGWTDSYSIPVTTGGALDFSDRWTINARMFLSFDARPNILEAAPWLRGARLSLNIENITDSVVEVRDETGATPSAYQEGYLNPLGRVVQLSFRKQW
jgi:iron complex outermembrane recepter protein